MPRPFTSRVVTANDLRLGGVVYLTADDRWSPRLSDAELLEDEAHAQLRLLHAESQPERVVGAYLAEARAGAAGPEPAHLRERLRAAGPSAYVFHRPPAANARRA
jgi:hypothetical protein